MDLLSIGKQLIGSKLGGSSSGVIEALSGLTGGQDGLDLGNLVDKAKQAGMGAQVSSWLGDGENSPLSTDQITSMFGEDKIAEAASKMGVDTSTAAKQLSVTVPNLLDKASSGGSITDQFSNASGALSAAKNLFGK